jgi:hypothetical protein
MAVSKRLDPGSSKLAQDDTEYSLMDLFRGNLSTIPPFHLSTSNRGQKKDPEYTSRAFAVLFVTIL